MIRIIATKHAADGTGSLWRSRHGGSLDGLFVDAGGHVATVAGHPVPLTASAFDVPAVTAQQPQRPFEVFMPAADLPVQRHPIPCLAGGRKEQRLDDAVKEGRVPLRHIGTGGDDAPAAAADRLCPWGWLAAPRAAVDAAIYLADHIAIFASSTTMG